MNSMTAYAVVDRGNITVTAKSVNGKFLDVNVSAPIAYDVRSVKDAVSKNFSRGNIDIAIKVTADSDILEKAKSYYNFIKTLDGELGGLDPNILAIVLDGLKSSFQSAANVANGAVEIPQDVADLTDECLRLLKNDRAREGAFLLEDLTKKVAHFENLVYNIDTWQPKMEALFRDTLLEKFSELTGGKGDTPCESLITTEVAIMLVRYTINEEVVRLHSHVDALKKLLKESKPVGKRLDFLCQEILRELNTISSKSQFAELSHIIVEGKDLLEGIREQSRNVE